MEKTICVFGDSVARWAYDELGWWVARLRKDIEDSENYDVFIYNQSIPWDNSKKLLKRFQAEYGPRTPQIIIFAIWKNDSQYVWTKNNPIISIEQFQNNLEELISQAIKFDFVENIIFVGLAQVNESKVSPIPWLTNTFADNDNITKYDLVIRDICNKFGLPYIELINLINEKDLDEEDWLHLNSQGHNKIFMKVKEYLAESWIV